MVYRASIISVMVASPSDVIEQRDEIRRIVNNWNFVNGYTRKIFLMPVAWETHAAPELSGRAQDLINDRLLNDCDLLVGVFWTRLGTPTGEFESGTVEEISRHIAAGKPAMVYFSNAPVAPQSIDREQYEKVLEFRSWCFERGLVAEFSNSEEFSRTFENQLQIQINSNPYLRGVLENLGEKDQVSTAVAELSEQAKELLLEAARDPHGQIMMLRNFSGQIIQTNGKGFGDPSNPRSSAMWEAAVEELRTMLYVVPRGNRGDIFQVTNSGYERADILGDSNHE